VTSTWASWLQYRSFFFLLAFMWMVPPLISLFVWTTAAGEKEIGGLSRGGFTAYYLILILVNQLTYAQTNWTVGDVIRSGGLTPWLLRPIPAIYHTLSAEAAGKVVYMAFVIPLTALLALLLHPQLDAGSGEFLLFVPALGLAWALRFFWGFWLALLAFWATRADALLAVQDSLVFLLAGVVAPVPLLPTGLQVLSIYLPFRYMVGFPVEILTGQLGAGDLVLGFSVQAAWLVAALALSRVVWRLGIRHYSAVGG
jgi:ABC-2 type transport system permease protein